MRGKKKKNKKTKTRAGKPDKTKRALKGKPKKGRRGPKGEKRTFGSNLESTKSQKESSGKKGGIQTRE